tara:strand:- start:928 stop:1170 length:243 start_codon:yes stop_codon:yes gene_type:complete
MDNNEIPFTPIEKSVVRVMIQMLKIWVTNISGPKLDSVIDFVIQESMDKSHIIKSKRELLRNDILKIIKQLTETDDELRI